METQQRQRDGIYFTCDLTQYSPYIRILPPIILILFAHIFFCMAAFSCSAFKSRLVSFDGLSPPVTLPPSFDLRFYRLLSPAFNFGIWKIDVNNQCQRYDPLFRFDTEGAPFRLAKAASVLGSLSGFAFLFWIISTLIVEYPQGFLKRLRWVMVLWMTLISSSLFVVLQNDFCTSEFILYDCSIAGPGSMSIASICFWIWAFVALDFVELKPELARQYICTQDLRRNLSPRNLFSQERSSTLPSQNNVRRQNNASQQNTAPEQRDKREIDPVSAASAPPLHQVPVMPSSPPEKGNSILIETVNHPDGSQTKTKTVTNIQPNGTKVTRKSVIIHPSKNKEGNNNDSESDESSRSMLPDPSAKPPAPEFDDVMLESVSMEEDLDDLDFDVIFDETRNISENH